MEIRKSKKLGLLLILSIFVIFINMNFVVGLEFNGTIYNEDGLPVNNTNITILIKTQAWSQYWQNTTVSNASGWFNITLPGTALNNYMYQTSIIHTNATTNHVDYVGQSVPLFPYTEFSMLSSPNFYLKEAGTINITAINSTGDRIPFSYQIKDVALGFPISSSWSSGNATIAYVEKGRNYSIMIYPQNGLPVSFDWNNFSSTSDYNIGLNSLSQYNATKSTLHKKFNITESFVRVNGYANVSGGGIQGFDEFSIIPFILEPGNMVFLGGNAAMPYNMSAWIRNQSGSATPQSDVFNLTNNAGYYNMTLPGPQESATYMLFISARNGSDYYGMFQNITLNYTSSDIDGFNITLYGLMNSSGWGTTSGNMSVRRASNWNLLNISSVKQTFNLVNATNSTLTSTSAHIEVTVDYTDYNVTEFTFMLDTAQTGSATFSLPLLNVTGIKEMNIYSMNSAPKRVDKMTVAQIMSNSNITMSSFNPGDIGGALASNQISITLYRSNSTCDVPTPAPGCVLASSATMATFNPLSAIIGGGKMSFRMGTGSIVIHYVNVDMLASGPPDGLFDNDAGASESSSSFSNAMRFGSGGPTIYDYVMVMMPYSEAAGTGLNDAQQVNMSIPNFYDENWNVIWSTGNNGTNASALGANYSHYSAKSSDWQFLMTSRACGSWTPNITDPCHINTTSNKIWIRLPHFSGTGPSATGSLVASTTSTTTTTTSSSGASSVVTWSQTYIILDSQFTEGIAKQLKEKERIRVNVSGENHHVGVLNLTSTGARIEISSDPVTIDLEIGEDAKIDVLDDGFYDVYVRLDGITDNKADVFVQSIYEEIPEGQGSVATTGDVVEDDEIINDEGKNKGLIVAVIIIVLVVLIGGGFVVYNKRR